MKCLVIIGLYEVQNNAVNARKEALVYYSHQLMCDTMQ